MKFSMLPRVSPHEHITFVSAMFEGSISYHAVTERSNLLELLERGDLVMANVGLGIQDILITRGVQLNILSSSKVCSNALVSLLKP